MLIMFIKLLKPRQNHSKHIQWMPMPETKMTVNKLLVADRVNDICPPYSFVALRNVSNRGVSVCIGNFTICQALCQELKCSREQERSSVCSPQILNLTEGTDRSGKGNCHAVWWNDGELWKHRGRSPKPDLQSREDFWRKWSLSWDQKDK